MLPIYLFISGHNYVQLDPKAKLEGGAFSGYFLNKSDYVHRHQDGGAFMGFFMIICTFDFLCNLYTTK